MQTSHNFSVEVNSHRIWNYLGDNYVHRIIRTKLGNESNKKYEEMEAEVLGQALGKSGSKNNSMGGSKGESTSKRKEDKSSFISVYEDELDAPEPTLGKQLSAASNSSAKGKGGGQTTVMMSLPDQFDGE